MENSIQPDSEWSLVKKLGFRFAFIYFMLFICLLDWYGLNLTAIFFELLYFDKLLDAIIPWVGIHLFQIDYPITSPTFGNHSDSTFIYIQYFVTLVVAFVGAIVWSLFDRKRLNYNQLHYGLTVLVRYYLAANLFAFALEKFFKTQFGDLNFYQLTQPLGDMTPMSFAYAFFGYSYPYNIFMGVAESAALLLLFRRTMPFGALLTAAAMANVVAVNISYDVHAKVYASMMLVMALFLLLPYIQRIFKFFFTGEAVALPIQQGLVFQKPWKNRAILISKILIIAFQFIPSLIWYAGAPERKRAKLATPLRGVYEVTAFVVNSDTLSTEHPQRWDEVILEGWLTSVRYKGDSIAFADLSMDKKEILLYGDRTELAMKKKTILQELGDEVNMDSVLIARNIKVPFYFTTSDSVHLHFRGQLGDDSVFVTAQRRPLEIKDFRLMKSKINVITEVPHIY
ncbi:MAG TPA: hypothetical protein PKE63_01000 [Lacibacter sp.]|nr:hypothetical protein [Lacibacter sp.]HMO89957.1 hypothetical protein [Lacibacter sp.]HMP85818.1 hypothetical protein [Lacibacter sp.]